MQTGGGGEVKCREVRLGNHNVKKVGRIRLHTE
jgi:hypothetical protein